MKKLISDAEIEEVLNINGNRTVSNWNIVYLKEHKSNYYKIFIGAIKTLLLRYDYYRRDDIKKWNNALTEIKNKISQGDTSESIVTAIDSLLEELN